MTVFVDRTAAGQALVPLLRDYAKRPDAIVLALPRGGVPVAYVVARALKLPLDVLVVRKLGAPNQRELAMGAIAAGGVVVLNPEVTRWFADDQALIDEVIARERVELERRELAYRSGRPPLSIRGKTAIVVDDGAATGATMRAAVQALRQLQPKEIVVALPTASQKAEADLRQAADRVLCLQTPMLFDAVGQWYAVFDQTTDREVIELLARANAEQLKH
jgi:predicted phosphoribosyltransferase